MTAVAALLVFWGALSFGAVYPWAYWPLFAVAAIAGVAGIATTWNRRPQLGSAVALSIAAVLAAVALQTIPLPVHLLAAVSPQTDRIVREVNVAYAAGLMTSHPLSIEPLSTMGRLIELIAFALFLLGLSRALTPRQALVLANAIVGLGAAVALIGIVQRSSGTDRIYGLWSPLDHPFQIFGPFVNKNHFAGWMLMPLGLGIGVLCGRATTAMSTARSDWRSRAIWWSSPEASQMFLVAGAVVVMAFAIVLTRSRSGNLCLGAAVLLALVAVIAQTRAAGRARRGVMTAAVVAVLAVAAVTWAGTQPVLARLQNEPALNGRLGAWRVALRMASDFPVAGTGANTFATAWMFYAPSPSIGRWEFVHNDYVQLMSEGGALIVVPFLVCAFVIARTAVHRLRAPQRPLTLWVRIGAVIALLSIGLQETVDFSLQLPGVTALFCVVTAFTVFVPERQ